METPPSPTHPLGLTASRLGLSEGDGWAVHGPEGEALDWRGFSTGPLMLGQDALARLCARLLGLGLADLEEAAGERLRCRASGAGDAPTLVLHGASTTMKGLPNEIEDLRAGRRALDAATFLETRAVFLARPGRDVCVGRTPPWRDATRRLSVRGIDLAACDYYYLLHQLLVLASEAPHGAISGLVDWLVANPSGIIRLRTLDTEGQILLLWLCRAARRGAIEVSCNAPDIARHWNRKTVLYPFVEQARELDLGDASPGEALAAEHVLSALRGVVDAPLPVLPGYSVRRADRHEREFVEDVRLAARLLRERHGLRLGCLKGATSGAGDNIHPGLDLHLPEALDGVARAAWRQQDDFVLEAHVTYDRLPLGDGAHILAPSAHIVGGAPSESLTLQLMRGASWKGNVHVDAPAWSRLTASQGGFHQIRQVMASLVRGFDARSRALGRPPGLVMGGVDFAVGRIRDGEPSVLAVQDLNLAAHGAEFLHEWMRVLGTHSVAGLYGATRVLRPAPAARAEAIEAQLQARDGPAARHALVGLVPGRWCMIASSHLTPEGAVAEVYACEATLVAAGLAVAP